jgi:hypothetical protein
MLDGVKCLAQLLREGVFWCESCVEGSTRELTPHITRRRTVVEQGNPGGTLALLLKVLKHVKVVSPGRNNITST